VRALVKSAPGPGGLALVERPVPVPGRGRVRLAVAAVGLCGTDVHIVHGSWPVPIPIVPGHEISGIVSAIGPGVTNVRIGDLVTTETDAFVCRRCRFCRRGDRHLCPRRTGIGTTADGGLADAVVVPAGGCHRLPSGVDPVAGALCEPLAVAVHAVVERGGVRPSDRVVVVGPGTIGLLCAQVARALGADTALAGLTRHADRFALGRSLGIRRSIVLDAGPPAPGAFDVAIECSGTVDGFAAAVRLVDKGGVIVQVGFFARPAVEVDLDAVINRELTIVASRGKRPSSFEAAIGFLAARGVRLDPLITDRIPLDQWEEAFAIAERPGRKVVVLVAPDAALAG
jgi:L-iditol 2-dehydrogenase